MSKTTENYVTGTGNNFAFEEEEKNDFRAILEEFESRNPMIELKSGVKMSGTLMTKNSRYAVVNIHGKSDVFIDNNIHEKIYLESLNIGETIDFMISEVIDKKEYEITGSIHNLKMIEVQEFLLKCAAEKTVLTGIPRDLNHAGYTVEVNINDMAVSLFMPHLLTDVNKLPDPEAIIDTEIDFLVESIYKEGKNSFIASRKAYLISRSKQEMKKLVTGKAYDGFVTGTTDFAVFVQFNGCLTGMIHKSNLTELAQSMLEKGEIEDGMTIGFYVKDILRQGNKTKLFLTQVLRDSLWDSIEVNQELTGTVSSIKDFGVLVSLDYETKGLLHKSVLSNHISKYKKGDKVNVVVTNVNKNNRQITLALK